MSNKKCEVKIVLHHDYLKIEDRRFEIGSNVIQLPISAAKMIHDMWEASGNTEKDIENYAVGGGSYFSGKRHISNPSFDLSVYIRPIQDKGNIFNWNTIEVPALTVRKEKSK